jgi:hypothetical protein
MKWWPRFLGCWLALAISIAAHAESPPILTAAEELLRQVTPENTSYKHKEPEVRWSTDPATPAYCHTDCSGLIIALLQHCDPQRFDDEALKRWLHARRPTARRFYNAIVAENGFRRITKVVDVRPGDLIVMKYQPGGENTGHTMLVAEAPRRAEKPTPAIVEGAEQWLVPIIDETGSGHGAADTRRGPDGKYRAGLGRGIFRLYARPDGSLVGYTWSTFANSKFYGDSERALAIGRLDPGFKP